MRTGITLKPPSLQAERVPPSKDSKTAPQEESEVKTPPLPEPASVLRFSPEKIPWVKFLTATHRCRRHQSRPVMAFVRGPRHPDNYQICWLLPKPVARRHRPLSAALRPPPPP